MAGFTGPHPVNRAPPLFVGRATARAWFEELLTASSAGEARVALISGPAGIGKTRLLRECLNVADQRDWLTLFGHCFEGASLGESPFEAVLRPRTKSLSRRSARATNRMVDSRDGITISASAARLARDAYALASRRPFVFAIDDLHLADAATLDYLAEFVRNVSDLARERKFPVLLLAAHHSTWPGQQLETTCRRILREPIATSFELAGLNETEVQELISQAAASRCESALLEHMMSRTGGNPFFVLELLGQLERRGLLSHQDGYVAATAPLDGFTLPFDAPAVVRERMEALTDEAHTYLRAAAIVGEEFHLFELADVVDHPPEATQLEPAVVSGLIQPRSSGSFAFSHGIVRQSLLESMSPIERRRIHGRFAAALRQRSAREPATLLRAANHYLASGTRPDNRDDARFLEKAGDAAMDSAAWSLGCDCYEAVMTCDSFIPTLHEGELGWLFARAARANDNAANGPRARELYARAIEYFRSARDFDGWGAALLGWQRSFILANEPLPPGNAIDEFLRIAGDAALDKRARLMALHAESLWLRRDPGDIAAALEAVQAASVSPDPEVAVYAQATLGLAQVRHLDISGAEDSFRAAARLADDVLSPRVKGLGRARLAWPLILGGQIRRASEAIDEALAVAFAGSDWPNSALGLSLRYVTASLRGDATAATRARIECSLMVGRSNYIFAIFLLNAAVAYDRMFRGEMDEAEDAVDQWARIAGRGTSRPLLALVRERGGKGDGEPYRPSMPREVDFIGLGFAATVVELAEERGDALLADEAANLLRPLYARGVRLSIAPPLLLARLLAASARLGGRFVDALSYLDQAAGLAAAEGLAVEQARVAFERSKLLVACGDPVESAAAPLGEAMRGFAVLDMPWALSACRSFASQHRIPTGDFPLAALPIDELSATEFEVLTELARGVDAAQSAERLLLNERTVERHLDRIGVRLGIRTSQEAREALKAFDPQGADERSAPGPDELTPREREVLQLVARGYSNRQIADELVISLHTAIRHVANILEKTGAANRTEAARHL